VIRGKREKISATYVGEILRLAFPEKWNRAGSLNEAAKKLIKRTMIVIAVSCLFSACTKKPEPEREPEGYRVVSYDAATHQWTILRNGTFDGKYLVKRMTVICFWSRRANLERIDGPTACHLQVGRMMVPNPFPPFERRAEFLEIFEMSARDEMLFINEGEETLRVSQAFTILRNEVLQRQ
jgi:hypothetical protein